MFAIHPSDLNRRRKRCREGVQRVNRLEKTVVRNCSFCGCDRYAVLANRDRYGCDVRTAICLECGLIFVVDRPTKEAYATFYEQGIYRSLISAFKGAPQGVKGIQHAQVYYADTLVRTLDGQLPKARGARLLDIGGSTGLVAKRFADHFGYKATVFDPAPDEVAAARALGLEAFVGSIEDFESDRQYDVLLLCRTVEHLFDFKNALTRIRRLMAPGAYFYCDLSDYLEVCRREGPPEATSKVDHCYWLTQESASAIFRELGFEVVSINVTMSPEQVGYLLRASEPAQLTRVSPEWIEQQIRKLREIETDWRRYGATPLDAKDWLRSNAYRVKKALAAKA
jgi:SAM-dependent methyltransferase